MSDEQEPSGPSLEPPSFFGRRNKRASADDTPTTILDDASAAPVPAAPPPTAPTAPAPQKAPRVKKPRNPVLAGRLAALIAGLLVGAGIVGATKASFGICESVRGTNSCGGPGLLLLVVILIAAVLVGAAVLRLAKVPDAGSTSFLAVGLVSVIALLFLIDVLFSVWMIVVIPLVSVVAFLGSHWVTTTFIEPGPTVGVVDEPEIADHDVR